MAVFLQDTGYRGFPVAGVPELELLVEESPGLGRQAVFGRDFS
jgi:hypothetical protein